ncbi:MAG: universal stress protein [Planctomycetes bacterium]|nr:universal stress protein [Planctomycetota bacterium]
MLARKILVPTDLSPEGERALVPIAEFARSAQAAVVLLHVIENPGLPPGAEGTLRANYLPGTTQEIERTQAVLESRRASLRGLEATLEVLVAPSVPHAIADYAAQKGCDLIALSSHGRTGFRRLVLGSVAEAVLRRARVPVLVFPRQE